MQCFWVWHGLEVHSVLLPRDKQKIFSTSFGFGQLHVERTASEVVIMHLRGQTKKLS